MCQSGATRMYLAIAIVAAIAIAEIVLSAKWNRFYFTTGLPIFASRCRFSSGTLSSDCCLSTPRSHPPPAGRSGRDGRRPRELVHRRHRDRTRGTLRRNIVDVAPYLGAALAIMYLIQGVRFWRVARALRG